MKKVFDKRNMKLLERLLENQGVSLKEQETSSVQKNINFINRYLDLPDMDAESEKRLLNLLNGFPDLDKVSDETKEKIANALKSQASDGKLDDREAEQTKDAVAKEVPADVELAPDKAAQEPELKLTSRPDGVNVKGILQYLSDHPRVSDEQVKSMKKYFDKIIPKNLKMFERDTSMERPKLSTKAAPKKRATPFMSVINNPELKKAMKMFKGPNEVGEVINSIVKMATQLKASDKQQALKAAAVLSRGRKQQKAKQAPVPMATNTGSTKNLIDTMSELGIPSDIADKVFDALEAQLQRKAPMHENKKRKVVIKYDKPKAKKKKS